AHRVARLARDLAEHIVEVEVRREVAQRSEHPLRLDLLLGDLRLEVREPAADVRQSAQPDRAERDQADAAAGESDNRIDERTSAGQSGPESTGRDGRLLQRLRPPLPPHVELARLGTV